MALTDEQAISTIARHLPVLDKRGKQFRKLELYTTGECPLPPAITKANVTKAYRMLMQFAQTNYGRLVVKSATSRLQVGGVRTGDEQLDQVLWELWQANRLDAESRRAHDTALTHGRAFAIVWPDQAGVPQITYEDPSTALVEYREGSRYDRVSAVRRWVDEDTGIPHITLYTPDALYKFQGPGKGRGEPGTKWERRIVEDEKWPLENPYGVVPVVELAVNRKLNSGDRYGVSHGDFESVVGLLDRINVLEFLRLVIAFTAGFPIRAVVGDRILRDDSGDPIAPYKLAVDQIAQFEDPNTKLVEIPAADIKSFGEAIDHDVETLAGITQTPSYYLRSVPIQNVSADAIIASDSPLNARIEDHKPDLSEGHEEILRVAAWMAPERLVVSSAAQVYWVNREARSLAAKADAASKLAGTMPWQFLAEQIFQLDLDTIGRYETQRAAEQLLAAPPDPASL